MRLLAVDTATELCSAALWVDGSITVREAWAPREHANLILPMIEALLHERRLSGGELDAIAFGRGPGAFTGVRLAASVAQGLAYAWGKPLLAISDLQALAARGLQMAPVTRALVCQDARMQEVYWACFEQPAGAGRSLLRCSDEVVTPPERVTLPQAWERLRLPILGAGSGFEAYAPLRDRLAPQLQALLPQLRPHAREIASIAAEEGLSAAVSPGEGLPVYLRDRVTSPSSN